MLSFYGRKFSRKTKNFDLNKLKEFEYFFDELKFRKLIKETRFNSLIKNLEIGFGSGDNILFQSLKNFPCHQCT